MFKFINFFIIKTFGGKMSMVKDISKELDIKEKNLFMDLLLRNLSMNMNSIIYFDGERLGVPIYHIELKEKDGMLLIIHDDILKAVIDMDKITAVVTGGVI